MGLKDTLTTATEALKTENISHALIGGFALAAYGVARATLDIDLLVDGQSKDVVKKIMISVGFSIVHETDEVLQLGNKGQLDIVFANREPTRKMLERARVFNQFPLRVVLLEDLVGLKIQAYVNDSKREFQDKADILALLQANPDADIEKIRGYADIFDQWSVIAEIMDKI